MEKNLFSPEELANLENFDFLTGLPTMSYFFKLADEGRKKLQSEGKQTVILFADLNGMKFFNSTHGFAEGSNLIRAFGEILGKYFGRDHCSRFGQDHFAVYTVVDRLEETLLEMFSECSRMNQGKNLPVKVGIYPDSVGIVETSLACDRAKYAGNVRKNDYHSYFRYFDEQMLEKEINRRYVLDNLDRALEENWITAYYQPIVRAANDRVCEEEALARWIDPERGMISPAEFIPVLEDSKLIYKVDLCMVDNILRKMKAQADAGLHLVPISVNLSRIDFEMCDVVEEVRRRVDASGLGRNKLVIEITESVIGKDFEYMKSQIERFQSLGFKVWMDDFGSGYSSLDVLQKIHFDLIKLDMRFMQEFETREESRIILTELIRMAMALGMETISEGVETIEQVEFLREVGCTKLQGYYFCKPISLDQLFERYRSGRQIGFENPAETEYYESIGRINLYDLAVVSNDDALSFKHYFDSLPMAVVETDGTWLQVSRCNKGYRDFMKRYFYGVELGVKGKYTLPESGLGSVFFNSIRQCRKDGKKVFFNEYLEDDSCIHAFVRRISVNPVTGAASCAVVILGIVNEGDQQSVSYTNVAQALSADYSNLFYVNMETEQFTEYRPDPDCTGLTVERHGEDFFHASRTDAQTVICEEDREKFISAFTKENVLDSLEKNGTFTLSYRMYIKGVPTYVNMKAVWMRRGGSHLIIGVNNVDSQMRQQEAFERMREEKRFFERMSVLAGDFICMYAVDPDTGHYLEYNVTREYEKLGLSKEGDRFFEKSLSFATKVIYQEDLEEFRLNFTRDNIIRRIRENGIFFIRYRLMIDGTIVPVYLRAGLVKEKGVAQLIMGISKLTLS